MMTIVEIEFAKKLLSPCAYGVPLFIIRTESNVLVRADLVERMQLRL